MLYIKNFLHIISFYINYYFLTTKFKQDIFNYMTTC